MRNCVIARMGASAVLAVVAGTCQGSIWLGGGNALLNSASSQAGNFKLTKTASVVYGSGGTFTVDIYAPWVIDERDAFLNSAVAEVVDGMKVGGVTTFTDIFCPAGLPGCTPASERAFWHEPETRGQVALLGTQNPNANNVIIDESLPPPEAGASAMHRDFSSNFGWIHQDGTAAWRANFNSVATPSQNNIEFTSVVGKIPPAQTAEAAAGTKMFNAVLGIDTSVGGSVFLSAPTIEKNGGNILLGQANFDNFTGVINPHFNIWEYTGALLTLAPKWRWLEANQPLPTTETVGDMRETAPVIKRMDCGQVYFLFGNGASGGTPYTGGATRARYLIVDKPDLDAQFGGGGFGDGYRNDQFIILPADPAGVYDPSTNRINPASTGIAFITTQGTGAVFYGASFDMNSKGDIVVVWENEEDPLNRIYQVRLYKAIRDSNCNITGYMPPKIIAQNDIVYPDGTEIQIPRTSFVPGGGGAAQIDTLVPFAGVGIDEAGMVSFVGVTGVNEVLEDVDNDGQVDDPVLKNTTNSLFVWEPTTDSLHRVVDGGQNGDTLPNTAGGPDLMVGIFAVDQSGDGYVAEGMSETGGFLAVCFRDGGDESGDTDLDGFDDDGGVLNPGTANEQSVRGVITVSLNEFTPTPTCPGDADGDGDTDSTDLNIVLTAFGCAGGGCAGDLDGDGDTDSTDLNIVLTDFGCT